NQLQDIPEALVRSRDWWSSDLLVVKQLSPVTMNDHCTVYHELMEVGILPLDVTPV
ncbi:hypothetical protein EWB00_009290, partial [Schistosoma japonicum]